MKSYEKGQKMTVWNMIGILAVFGAMSEFTILTPSIAAFAQHFANTDITTIMLANSITGIVSVPVSILSGALMNKVGFKPTAIVGITIMTLSGAAPFLFPDLTDYLWVIISRVGVGIGLGIMFPVGAATIIAFFEGVQRSRLLGLGFTVQFVFSIIYTIVAGYLTEIAWNFSFLSYLIAFIPMILVAIFMPEGKYVAVRQLEEDKKNNVPDAKAKQIPHGIWGYAFYGLIVWICLVTVQLVCSTVFQERSLGDAGIASIIISCCGVGIIVQGIVFPYLVKYLKNKIFAVMAALVAIGMIPCFFADSPAMYGIGVFLIGVGGSAFFNAAQNAAGNITPKERVPFVSGVMTSMMNLGPFFAPYIFAASASAIPALGTDMAFITCFVFAAVACLFGLFLPLKGIVKENED